MAIPLIVNGVTFQYPSQFDKNWGPTLTNWSSAVTSGMLQKAGGTFTLTAETNFGASFGLKTLYIKSTESNIAATGILRLGNASTGVVWRNAANNADLALTVNASNQLTFNGTSIGATTSLTNGHILVGNVSNQPADVAVSGDVTITNAGVTAIGAGKVLDANVGGAAAIARSKIAAGTVGRVVYNNLSTGLLTDLVALAPSRLMVTDTDGLPYISTATALESTYLSGVGSPIQTQINGLLPLSGGTLSGILNMGGQRIAAIATPTTAGDAARYPITTAQITANSVTTGLLASHAVTQAGNANGGYAPSAIGTTLGSVTLTTTGGQVLIMASLWGISNSGTSGVFIGVERDSAGTYVAGSYNGCSGVSTLCAASTTMETPAAGSHTWALKWEHTTNGAINGSGNAWSLTVVELKA